MKYVEVEVGPRFGKNYSLEQKNDAVRSMAASRFGGPKGNLPTPSKDY
jgi:hypothetical protein